MFTGKKLSKTLYAVILYIALFGQNIQANLLPFVFPYTFDAVKCLLALSAIGQNGSFRENVPLYAKTQDYFWDQTKKGFFITTNAIATNISDINESLYQRYQIYMNEDNAYRYEIEPEINISQELAEVTPGGRVIREDNKTAQDRGVEFLNKITGKCFQCEKRKIAKSVWVDIDEKNPISRDGEIFYDAHQPETSVEKDQTSKVNSSSNNSYWKRISSTFNFFL